MSTEKALEFLTIPNTWDSALLGREEDPILNLIRNGLTIPQDKNEGDYKITRIETIGDGFIDERRVRFVSNVREEIVEKYLIRKDDILFSHINSDPHIGKTAIATHDYPDLLHGMNLLLMRPNSEVVDPYFLHFVFRFYRQIGVFIKICARAVNQSSINQEKLRALELPLPSILEQRSISLVLTTVQTAIEKQARLIELTRELKSALMHKLLTEGLCGEKQKETEIGLVPENWDVVELASMLEDTEQVNLRTEGKRQIKYIDVSCISREHLLVETTTEYLLKEAPGRARKKVKIGDVIFATVRPTLLRVAYIGEGLNDQVCSTAFCVLRAKEDVSDKYIYYVVQRDQFIKQLAAIESGASYPAVTDRQVKNQKVPKPKLDEQSQIAERLDTCDKKAFQHAMKKEKLEELFRTLLHQLMTGQTRVNEIDLPGLS